MLDRNNFSKEAELVSQWVQNYLKNIDSFPVKSQVQPKDIYNQIPDSPPLESENLESILKDLNEIILPGITHWQHPNYHAYFNANSSVESLLAEHITTAIAAQCMIWETSPAAAELEERMMEWLRDNMALPKSWEGVIQDTASTATLAAILTAREIKTDFRSNVEGVPNNLRVYCSKETHSSIEKAVAISGIGTKNLVKIEVDEKMRLIPEALEKRIEADIAQGLVPCCVVVAIGTTGTVAVDPLKPIARICKKHDIFLHVDAAFAGTALLLPEYQWMIEGIEEADAFVFNPHKWMFTNFDCTAYFVKDVQALVKTFEVLPEYLKTKTRGQVNDYRDWGIPLGRRFRALKLWFVLRSFGLNGIQKRLREHIQLTEYFAENIKASGNFELVLPAFLNFSCFRFHPPHIQDEEQLNQLNEELVQQINASGHLYLTHTKIKGKYVLRMVIGQTYVEQKHVDHALEVIKSMAETLV